MCKDLRGVVKPMEAAPCGTCSMHRKDQKCVNLQFINWNSTKGCNHVGDIGQLLVYGRITDLNIYIKACAGLNWLMTWSIG
jgi:hypothetical protein